MEIPDRCRLLFCAGGGREMERHLVFRALILFLPNDPAAVMWNRWSSTHLSFMSFFLQCRDSVLVYSAGEATDFTTKKLRGGTCTSTSRCIPFGGIQSVPAAVWPDQAPSRYTALIFILRKTTRRFYPVSLKIHVVEAAVITQPARQDRILAVNVTATPWCSHLTVWELQIRLTFITFTLHVYDLTSVCVKN